MLRPVLVRHFLSDPGKKLIGGGSKIRSLGNYPLSVRSMYKIDRRGGDRGIQKLFSRRLPRPAIKSF